MSTSSKVAHFWGSLIPYHYMTTRRDYLRDKDDGQTFSTTLINEAFQWKTQWLHVTIAIMDDRYPKGVPIQLIEPGSIERYTPA